MTTEPIRTCSWIEPLVPMRMIVRMPTWTSSLTTMLIDGAPIPLVAHTTGAPPGQRRGERVEPRWRDSSRIPLRCSVAMRSDRDGSPLSKAIVVPASRSSEPNPRWYSAFPVTPVRLSRVMVIGGIGRSSHEQRIWTMRPSSPQRRSAVSTSWSRRSPRARHNRSPSDSPSPERHRSAADSASSVVTGSIVRL